MSSSRKSGIARTRIVWTICASLVFGEVTTLAQSNPEGSQKDNNGKQNQPLLRPTGQYPLAEKMIIELSTGETQQTPALARSEGKLARWFELEMATLSIRYQFIRTSLGETVSDQAQHQQAFKGRFKLDSKGRYSIHAGVFPGRTFQSSWNSTGLGTGKPRTNLLLRELYFSGKPVEGIELQYGGLYITRGQSTEVSSYDYDGYIIGQRFSLMKPGSCFFDEVSITYGHLGDVDRPNVFSRFHRLKKSNYHQYLVTKRVGARIITSADYTFESGVDTFRQAVKINVPEIRVIEALHFENYERNGDQPGYGFGVYGEKKLSEKLALGGGYAQLDRSGLQSDRFPKGKRIYFDARLTLSPEFSISTAVTRAVGTIVSSLPRTRFELAFSYNLLESLRTAGL